VPTLVNYELGMAERHPTPLPQPEDQPHLELTDADEADWADSAKRDTVVGFGNDRAVAWLADMLIDVGSHDSGVVEVDLESFAGFGGVGPGSAELRIWLPGSDFWRAGDFEI
jgi:hypothetical protein